ncbi:hypothetical protein FOB58_005301 [Candida parapsilosis]|uniref:Uncharacterized protein n=2 Tax=Candida parapsilosis TaxID=5480 RepID=G8B558_CANPC|nr:uncharacterized protein CPAR2_601700 [Candida parapsilosis]KAF6043586.1 hypothetical protein FOB58_005301 [Candida parapsilosis]KAF6043916.1 hypothetical protein FOB59_004872 [Candida parapsilosis]KAF6045464.1 hypothetical protein FOB60_005036 [Candida parapsilosis]KAF6060250.1 hypothetical protein FOB61_005265 [Candida parapsilosis]KAI5904257.1 hypothetical protein K4G60_g3415 [Candida parapsilosis]
MGWLSFGSQKTEVPPPAPPLGSPILEQRSHQQLPQPPSTGTRHLINDTSDIETTLNQLSSDSPSHDIKLKNVNDAKTFKDADSTVGDFIHSYPPSNMFVIDGEKDIKESIICTSNRDGGKTCLKLKINSIELFKIMQKHEYFCSLPNDINATYFECRKIK